MFQFYQISSEHGLSIGLNYHEMSRVDYTIDVSTPLDFGKDFVNDLTELVSLSVPTLEVDGDWSFVNEYFKQTRSDRFQEFRTDRLDVRCYISDSRFN